MQCVNKTRKLWNDCTYVRTSIHHWGNSTDHHIHADLDEHDKATSSSGIDHGIFFGWEHTMKCDHICKMYQLHPHTTQFTYVFLDHHYYAFFFFGGEGQTRVTHTLHSYFRTDQEGWRSTGLHCSWWGCPLCCTHIEWCIHQELSHCPLHWLSLCAL